ncbi:MAG: hypothetical protein E6Q37_06295 [Crocinitomicaceae bacterium]|nr:MAG: hypothetical protein E6Q37_06295 [Crocinitomicaceae bacterium]
MGLIRTVLLIIGVIVALRFIGQLMIAKRNLDEERKSKAELDRLNKLKKHVEKNQGKVTLVSKNNSTSGPYEDVDYEEVKK